MQYLQESQSTVSSIHNIIRYYARYIIQICCCSITLFTCRCWSPGAAMAVPHSSNSGLLLSYQDVSSLLLKPPRGLPDSLRLLRDFSYFTSSWRNIRMGTNLYPAMALAQVVGPESPNALSPLKKRWPAHQKLLHHHSSKR
jgi:hypothetical protein